MIKFFLKSKFLKKKVFLLSPTTTIIIIIIKLGYEKKSFKKTTIIYRIKVFHVSFLEPARYNTIIQIKKS
jgi:hypothetical protein